MSIHVMPVSFRRAAFVSEHGLAGKRSQAKTAVLSIDPAILRQLARMRPASGGFGPAPFRRSAGYGVRVLVEA